MAGMCRPAAPIASRTRAAGGAGDAAELVALVACARRELLLAVHRHRLTRDDLEDCYSQATLELLTRARRGDTFAGPKHIANALELRLLSRIHDRRRALSGRSPLEAALARAIPLAVGEGSAVCLADARADVERTVLIREELLRIAELSHRLSVDQRLALAHRLSPEADDHVQFCKTRGWSVGKYRKVCQRARARLRVLLEEDSRIEVAPSVGPRRAKATGEKEVSPPAPRVGRESRDTPMTATRPTHRRVLWDAEDRLPRRSDGASHSHVAGRERDISPSTLPAARVTSRDRGGPRDELVA
jgi:hypothetical protein